jgi:hypothetical protein
LLEVSRKLGFYDDDELVIDAARAEEQEEAVHAILRMGVGLRSFRSDAFEVYAAYVQHTDPTVRMAAVQAIAYHHWPEAQRLLAGVVTRDPDQEVRDFAVPILETSRRKRGDQLAGPLDFISEVTVPEYFLIVDHSESGVAAAQVLRAAWPRVDAVDSADIACARIAVLDEHRDDLVVIVDADLLDGALELRRVLASRQNTIVMLALNDLANDRRAASQRFVVGKPYDDTLLDQTEEVVSRLRLNRILVHVVSILMTDSPEGWNAAGSGCLVQLPERAVILTAGHVVERMQHEGTMTYIGGNGPPVDISSWPVLGLDKIVDIATIGIPQGFDPQVIRSRFYVPPEWPPTRAQPGNAVIMVGFPSAHRIPVDGMSVSHGALVSDFVSSSSTLQFVTAPKDMDRKFSSMTERVDSIEATGGMSGCPMFVAGQGEKAQLRGVLKEGGSGPNAVIFGAHADFVRADGTIDDSLMR